MCRYLANAHSVALDSTMAHRDSIRQVAPSLTSGRDILSGGTLQSFVHEMFIDILWIGFDKTIHLWNVREGKISPPTVTIPCNQVVSSVRWHPRDPKLFSWSTDPGTMVQYDTRVGSSCWQFSPSTHHVRKNCTVEFEKNVELIVVIL